MKRNYSASQICSFAFISLSVASFPLICSGDEVASAAEKNADADVTLTAPEPSPQGKLTASQITYDGSKIIAKGTADEPARYEGGDTSITAQEVLLDTEKQTVSATGTVVVTRQIEKKRRRLTSSRLRRVYDTNEETETLRGEHFFYDYGKRQGRLDDIWIRLADFDISADNLTIEGDIYTATNVTIRPGGLSDEELKIYGTPPLNMRAKSLTVDNSRAARANLDDRPEDSEDTARPAVSAQGASLYFKGTKIIPVPNYALRQATGGGRGERPFTVTPKVSVGSTDGILLTTQLQYDFNRNNPNSLLATADLGLSARQNFRGGFGLEKNTSIGGFNINAHFRDIITNRLDDRIRLNRVPEINYKSPGIGFFDLPGNRRVGLRLGASWGNYREYSLDRRRAVHSSRTQAYATLTTRLGNPRGIYGELTLRQANYGNFDDNQRTLGAEIGYYGSITPYIDGQFSYSYTDVKGSTPFIFDEIEIRRELRATFDILPVPRYIIPIDLRYDLDRNNLREKRFGIMRNYKTFAYGLMYSSSRRQLGLEFRQGF